MRVCALTFVFSSYKQLNCWMRSSSAKTDFGHGALNLSINDLTIDGWYQVGKSLLVQMSSKRTQFWCDSFWGWKKFYSVGHSLRCGFTTNILVKYPHKNVGGLLSTCCRLKKILIWEYIEGDKNHKLPKMSQFKYVYVFVCVYMYMSMYTCSQNFNSAKFEENSAK